MKLRDYIKQEIKDLEEHVKHDGLTEYGNGKLNNLKKIKSLMKLNRAEKFIKHNKAGGNEI